MLFVQKDRIFGENGYAIMNRLYLHPLFLLGLIFRIGLIICMAPYPMSEWYVPFLDASTSNYIFDPWTKWLADGGTNLAFPYGYAMWLIFLPFTYFAKFVGIPLEYAYNLTLLTVDMCFLITLCHFLPKRKRLLLAIYWLSPIVIVATYVLGFNDLIPALLLSLSIFYIQNVELKKAGILCAAAISAKLSMIVALPFFGIYLYHNKPIRQHISQFVLGFTLSALILCLPYLTSYGGIQMLIGNPEMSKIYHASLNIGELSVYIVPLIYLVILYFVWRVRRLNFDLFQAVAGVSFLLIALMTPASPGWFVWSMPFLVLYQAMSGRVAILLIGIFSLLYVLSTFFLTPLQFSNGLYFDLNQLDYLAGSRGEFIASLFHTAMVAIGVVLSIRIWRESISLNDFFRLSRKPFVIGIAGDSGAGKDTLADALKNLFGDHSVVTLSGDDYHLWDRQKPMWQVMTHLNPMANDLEGFCRDLVALADGKNIQSRHYNHETGKMSKPIRIRSNDFIIASGLHALYLPILRDCYDLKVYLDIDEGLRKYFKIKRDVELRGHTLEKVLNSFEKRAPDSEKFIRPQANYADLIFVLQPIHPQMLDSYDDKHQLRLQLAVKIRRGFNEVSLNRVLVGVCGLHVDIVVSDKGSELELTIEGDASAEDIELAVKKLCPNIIQFFDVTPTWEDGMVGLMQLIMLSHINQELTKRFVK